MGGMAALITIAQISGEFWRAIPEGVWVALISSGLVAFTKFVELHMTKRQSSTPPPAPTPTQPDALTAREWLARLTDAQDETELAQDACRKAEMEAERLRAKVDIRDLEIQRLQDALAQERNTVQRLLAEQHFREKA